MLGCVPFMQARQILSLYVAALARIHGFYFACEPSIRCRFNPELSATLLYLSYRVHAQTQARATSLQEKVLEASRSLAALRTRGQAAKKMEATLILEASCRETEQCKREKKRLRVYDKSA